MSEFLELIDDTNCGFNPIPKIYHDYAPTLRAGRFGLKKRRWTIWEIFVLEN